MIEYNTQFDGNTRTGLRISPEEIRRAYELTSPALIEDLKTAAQRLEDFAVKQKASLHGLLTMRYHPAFSGAEYHSC
ncbi:MAG: histidinol dehydrogenase [Blautia marasmi]